MDHEAWYSPAPICEPLPQCRPPPPTCQFLVPKTAPKTPNPSGRSGPLPADGVFAHYEPGRYDAIIAMYHDQGLIPFKLLARNRGVNFSAGLEIIRTSPAHGTAFDIAGRGTADPSSMAEAIRLAARLARRRRAETEGR